MSEAEDAVNQLRNEFPNANPEMFIPECGNIFARNEHKDMDWNAVLSNPESRKTVISDIFNDLTDEVLKNSALYTVITKHQPDVVIDCINTATAIAYQDIYNTSNTVIRGIKNNNLDTEAIERLLSSLYMPQLIRHVQIVYKALLDAKTTLLLKIGTSGTGGMGLNIPYTHSEERPSKVLLAKTAVAGAQTLLLFLMARTPNGPIVKEVKPTATIAWKRIAYDKVYRKGRPIPLVDMEMANAKSVGDSFKFVDETGVNITGKDFESVFIDTGENGIFSRGEFTAISSLGQMEIVTPEEIAECAVFEISGGNSGKDVIQGMDAFTLGPTYRGGILQNSAVRQIDKLEKEHGIDSVAFELLGPPRLSKLLYEANIIKRICGNMKAFLNTTPEEMSAKSLALVSENGDLRAQMLSVGLAVMLPDGKNYLRGVDVKIPVKTGDIEIPVTEKEIEKWCFEGWVDLRTKSFIEWQQRITKIVNQVESIPAYETSSRYTYTKEYWDNFETFDEGKISGWVFEYEDHGWRFKR
jgi:hypothetical protein